MTLDDVVTNGNTTNRGAYFGGDLEASGYFLGDATYITNLPYVGLIAYTVAAINELREMVDELENA